MDLFVTARDWLNQGWVGIVVGILIGLYFFLRTRTLSRLSYQVGRIRLIGAPHAEVSKDVVVTFRGIQVKRLSKVVVVVWNSGTTSVAREQLIAGDPLRIEVDGSGEVLDVQTVKVTRDVNQVSAQVDKQAPNRALCTFEFLDPGDGFRVELLHTAEKGPLPLKGTVRGMPRGFKFHAGGVAMGETKRNRTRWEKLISTVLSFSGFLVVTGLLFVLMGMSALFPEIVPPRFIRSSTDTPDRSVAVGLITLFLGGLLLLGVWLDRGRFPKSLAE